MADLGEPSSGRIVVIVGQGGIQTDLDLDTLSDPEVSDIIPDLLADYSAECKDWTLFAGEHWKQGRWGQAEELLVKGVRFFAGGGRQPDYTALVNLHAMLAHLHLALARSAPKVILPYAKYDQLAKGVTVKEHHYTEATANINRADEALRASGAGVDDEPASVAIAKIILHLARGAPNLANPLVERLLQKQPNNLVALTAQARLQFARRSYELALQTYQKLLNLKPDMSPDPRIGLGLCAFLLGDKDRARAAWERSLERDSSSWTSLLLLGLASLNTAREPSASRDDRLRLEAEGVAYVQRAFKLNNKCAAAALALAGVSGQGGQIPLASKLAERAIQYADNKRHSILANAERGRLGFIAGDVADAGPFIAAAKAEDTLGVNLTAELTLGQIAIKNGNLREALNFIEQTAKRLNGKGPLEYTVLHASLLAYPHPGMGPEELAKNRATARTMLSDVHSQVLAADTEADWAGLRGTGQDADIFIDLAKLWQDESLDKAIASYQTAVSISSDNTSGEAPDLALVRLSSNLGALYHLQGNVDTAERMYQEALQRVASQEGKDGEVLKTVLAYNLGRAYEEGGDVVKASKWYRDVLRQHPEHMESKVRLALLAAAAGRNLDAHNLLKECLKSDETNLTLRSVYTNFLISLGSNKEALTFTTQTLKYDRSDVFTFCALGWLHFTLGREAKTPQEVAERTKQYLRSAEAYERALVLDSGCAMAAQGLAIALAEDTLIPRASAATTPAEEAKSRVKAAGQALSVFSRIKDSLTDGPVNVNIGHCYFTRGEEERAIEAYGTALTAFKGQNVNVLLYLARAWYGYANRESNFSAMNQALSYCQKAMHLQPSDRAILFNIAMIQQKAAEMLFALDPSKRTLDELKLALEQAQQAASTFRTLADDKSGALAYDADLADQRARYGDGLLRKAPEQLSRQETFENENQARLEEARKLRAEEQARIQAAEDARKAEIEARAAELAEQRRVAREEAREWQQQLSLQAAEEEARRQAKSENRKRKKEEGDIESDDGIAPGGDVKPRRKKSSKKKRKGGDSSEEEGVVEESSEEDRKESVEEMEARRIAKREKALEAIKAKAKKKSRKTVADPDEDDDTTTTKRGKQFKSKAFIEDSDDDMVEDEKPSGEVTRSATEAGTGSPEAIGENEVDDGDDDDE